jgi:hypothetical protein
MTSFTLRFTADHGGHYRRVEAVLDRILRVREQLAAYCEGEVSYYRPDRVDLDLAVTLVDEDGFLAEGTALCFEPVPDDTFILPLEERVHGVGPDLADVLGLLNGFTAELAFLYSQGAYLAPGSRVEIALDLVLASSDPRLAARLGLRAA